MVKVVVKWGKNTYSDVELDPSSFETFQAQLLALTGVPVTRQKILSKGKMIKASGDLASVAEGQTVNLMGTADAIVQGPLKPIVFEEDLSDRQKAEKLLVAPGLQNLGNTCYMNSTLQTLRHIVPLKDVLRKYYLATRGDRSDTDIAQLFTSSLGALFSRMDSTTQPVMPLEFVQHLRLAYPQFDETDEKGHHKQQDADECLSQTMATLASKLRETPAADDDEWKGSSQRVDNIIDYLFGGEQVETLTCVDPEYKEGAEPPQVQRSVFRKLRCHIDAKVNFMTEGIQNSFEEIIEKRSPSLGRNAEYKKVTQITKMPKFLVVQYVRFFWRSDTQKRAKIVRPVVYPDRFDILPLGDAQLKADLTNARLIMNAEKERVLGLDKDTRKKAAPLFPTEDEKKKKEADAKKTETKKDEPAPMDVDKDKKDEKEKLPPRDVPSSGFYELLGVVTHKGRMAESGHYIGWAKQKDGKWLKFDDAVVTEVPEDDIKTMAKAGADSDMAYLLFFGRLDDVKELKLKQLAEAQSSSSSSSVTTAAPATTST